MNLHTVVLFDSQFRFNWFNLYNFVFLLLMLHRFTWLSNDETNGIFLYFFETFSLFVYHKIRKITIFFCVRKWQTKDLISISYLCMCMRACIWMFLIDAVFTFSLSFVSRWLVRFGFSLQPFFPFVLWLMKFFTELSPNT